MLRASPENYNIKTRIGPILFDIYLDDSFLSAQAPSRSNRHNHANFELHFIVEGGGLLMMNGEEIRLQPGHYYVIPPGVYHAILTDPAIRLSKYTFRFDYTELNDYDTYFPANEVERLKTALTGIGYFYERDQAGNICILHDVIHELSMQSLGYYAKLQSCFNQVLVNVIRSTASGTQPPYRIPSRLGEDNRSLIIDAFFDQYRSDLTLEQLAGQLQLSPRQTRRILSKLYGTTFMEKLEDIRIEEAKDRLKHSKDSILMISEKLGFTSQERFCTLFKQKTGETPQSYRKAWKSTEGREGGEGAGVSGESEYH